MKNNHWRSFKKGMSWFLTFAIAIGSQGTGLSGSYAGLWARLPGVCKQ